MNGEVQPGTDNQDLAFSHRPSLFNIDSNLYEKLFGKEA
jgi:hypothetical protein